MQPVPIEKVKGIGAARVQQLQKLDIHTVEDLLCHLPRDYHDLTQLYTIDQMRVSVPWFGKLEIVSEPSLSYPRRSMNIVRAKAVSYTHLEQPLSIKMETKAARQTRENRLNKVNILSADEPHQNRIQYKKYLCHEYGWA